LEQKKQEIMEALFVLIIASVIVAVGFLIAFIWNVKDGQYDDDYTPSVRMLFDDEIIKENKTPNSNQPTNNQ
jgi:cbb3-type cytochrome oxidase maturation protein